MLASSAVITSGLGGRLHGRPCSGFLSSCLGGGGGGGGTMTVGKRCCKSALDFDATPPYAIRSASEPTTTKEKINPVSSTCMSSLWLHPYVFGWAGVFQISVRFDAPPPLCDDRRCSWVVVVRRQPRDNPGDGQTCEKGELGGASRA